jgi:hypothetical protein
MIHPALNTNRQTIFDPCYSAGSTAMMQVAPLGSDLLGLAHGAPKGAEIKLLRIPMGEAYQMLDAVGTRFDLIVSAPPLGTVPAKGLPKAAKAADAAPVGRKLFFAGPTDAAPEVDAGYATWLVTNALLTPFGEAMLRVRPGSYGLIAKDPNFTRVWRVVEEFSVEDLGHEYPKYYRLFIARDHRRLPGSDPMKSSNQPTESERRMIRGSVVTWNNRATDTVKKFYAIRDELQRRSLADFSEHNLRLDNNLLRVRFTEFQIMSGHLPQDILDDVEKMRNRSLVDLAVMRDSRDMAKKIFRDKRLNIAPGLVQAFDDVCQQMVTLTAPFVRPSAVQRVAWLDEQNSIKCQRAFATFEAGKMYPLQTRVITGLKEEKRHRPGHKDPEDVLVTGQEVMIVVDNPDVGDCHCFTQFALTPKMDEFAEFSGLAHSLNDLITNFEMPDVQDIAESDPSLYLKYVNRLRALETT